MMDRWKAVLVAEVLAVAFGKEHDPGANLEWKELGRR